MHISDIINIILSILSFILAAISIVIVVLTLNQNNKMIENSTRPYVSILCQTTNFQNPLFYVIIKNYGNSGATITGFEPSINLKKYSYNIDHIPFDDIVGTFIAPNQSIICALNPIKLAEIDSFNIKIEYSAGAKIYSETYPINFKGYTNNVQVRASTKDKELKIISYTLQDLVEKNF